MSVKTHKTTVNSSNVHSKLEEQSKKEIFIEKIYRWRALQLITVVPVCLSGCDDESLIYLTLLVLGEQEE